MINRHREWNSSKRQTRAVKNNEFTLVKDKCDHTFKRQAATVYNNLPLLLRKCEKHDIFVKDSKKYYLDKAMARVLSEA